MKFQRNEPCFCGTGVKFKKCCYLRGVESSEDVDIIRTLLVAKRAQFQNILDQDNLLVGRHITSQIWKQSRAVGVSNGFYLRNKTETFHEFLVHQLKHGLGWNWGASQMQQELGNRHIYLRWLSDFAEFIRKMSNDEHK